MDKALRYGWTTGACSAAASRAAVRCLKSGGVAVRSVCIDLPKRTAVEFAVHSCRLLSAESAEASVIKDAGDDPDVTHGAEIICRVRLVAGSEVLFRAGEGVGTVTKAGLPLAVGEAAINPSPRAQITDNIRKEWGADRQSEAQGFEVTISIKDGERLAQATWNARLGIIGGLSILGTSGVVVPYSCSAWIHSIRRGIDVGRAENARHLGAATGKQSEAALMREKGFNETRILDMGDFVGGMLKYLRRNPVERLTIAGGFGKMVKLSQGAMDLHSHRSQVDFARLAELVALLGGGADLSAAVRAANTALEARRLCEAAGVDIAAAVAEGAARVAQDFVGDAVRIAVMLVGREGEMLAEFGGDG